MLAAYGIQARELNTPCAVFAGILTTSQWNGFPDRLHTQKGKNVALLGTMGETVIVYILPEGGTRGGAPATSHHLCTFTFFMGLCPELAGTGTCSLLDCKQSHDTSLFCADCNVLCMSRSQLNSHLKGRKHQKVVQSRANESGHICRICNMVIGTNPTVWAMHIEGKRHRTNAGGLGTTVVAGDTPTSDTWCDVCAMCLPTRQVAEAHRESLKHKRRAQLAEVGGRIKESQQSKHGVLVSHDSGIVDMPFVDVETISEAFSRTSEIKITADSPLSRLVSVRFLSSGAAVSRQSWFYIGATPPVRLYKDDPLDLPIIFEPAGQQGYFTDTIELNFENTGSGQQWKVSRTIRVTVGVAADHALLQPVAPYVRRPRRTGLQVQDPLPGPVPPSKTTIPYIKPFPRYPLKDTYATRGSFGQRVATIQSMLPRTVDGRTYKEFWSALLFVEEHQMRVDIEEYDLVGVPLTRHERYFYLEVPGLAENRPSVLVGDSVHLSLQRNRNQWFEGRVHVVREKEVGLRFHARFAYNTGDLCEARFTIPRITIRRMHDALNNAFSPDRILFPNASHLRGLRRPSSRDMQRIVTFNPLIASNPPQLQAVTAVVNRPPGSIPFIIWGPPGTGKTITVVESIRQVLENNPQARILACAPSNSAADLIAQRLISLGRDQLFRLNAPSRDRRLLPDELRDFVYMDRDNCFSVRDASHLNQFRVVVSTCMSASILSGVGVESGHFTHIFVDEAGQAMEPEIMVPIKTIADEQTTIILSGDPKQLGPIIRSAVASRLGLATSFLNRLVERPVYSDRGNSGITMVKLTKNWRNHASILQFPNDNFYNGELEACGPLTVINSLLESPVLARKNFPVVFHGIAGLDAREEGSPSFFNVDEISLIYKYVDELRNDRVRRITNQDIGVISPYNAQGKKLRKRLQPQYEGIQVGSVEQFQGQERTVILITTVRSQRSNVHHDLKHLLGFLVSPRRMNVALTRAKALLVVVGNPLILGLDPLWRKFLNYVYRNGGWKGLQPDWDPNQDPPDGPGGSGGERTLKKTGRPEMESLAEELMHGLRRAMEGDTDSEDDYDEGRREANEDRGPWVRGDNE